MARGDLPQRLGPRLRAPSERGRAGGFDCNDGGPAWRFVDEAPAPNACGTTPLCDVPFGKIEACLRSTFLGPPEKVCRDGVSPACDGLLGCLPYLDRGTLK